jgi:hypothetical protein
LKLPEPDSNAQIAHSFRQGNGQIAGKNWLCHNRTEGQPYHHAKICLEQANPGCCSKPSGTQDRHFDQHNEASPDQPEGFGEFDEMIGSRLYEQKKGEEMVFETLAYKRLVIHLKGTDQLHLLDVYQEAHFSQIGYVLRLLRNGDQLLTAVRNELRDMKSKSKPRELIAARVVSGEYLQRLEDGKKLLEKLQREHRRQSFL